MPDSPSSRFERAFKAVSRVSGVLYIVMFVPMILLNLAFYRLGSPTPDPATGRVYPVNEHGILYVVPWQGRLAQNLFWAAMATFVLFFLGRWRERRRGKA